MEPLPTALVELIAAENAMAAPPAVVAVAEAARRRHGSGIAAVLVATEPLWIAILMPGEQASRWSPRVIGGLAAGLIGVGLLVPQEAFATGSSAAPQPWSPRTRT